MHLLQRQYRPTEPLFVCPPAYLETDAAELHQIFCEYCLWPLLDPRLVALRCILCTSGFVDDDTFHTVGSIVRYVYFEVVRV